MVNLAVGLLSSLSILLLYKVFERKRVEKIGNVKYIFILLILISSHILNPIDNLTVWFIWLLMYYTVLDDLKTQTVFTPVYIVVILILFVLGKPFQEFIYAMVLFVIFFLISKKTRETFFSVGDTFVILVLFFWLGKHGYLALILSVFLAGATLPVMAIWVKRVYFPFSTYLVLSGLIVQAEWHNTIILVICFVLNLCFFISSKFRTRSKKQTNK